MKNSEILRRLLDMVPMGYLRPAIGNRADYIHIIQQYSPKNILDIGTGSVAIYLVLLELHYPEVNRFGIEKNLDSYNNALEALSSLGLSSEIAHCSEIPKHWINKIDFIICNPPFYKSQDHITASKLNKGAIDKLEFNGLPHELITDGGEVEFLKSIINQTLIARNLEWCSAMFGFKSSIEEIKKYLKYIQQIFGLHLTVHQHKISYRTIRWVLVWKFKLKRSFIEYCSMTDSQLLCVISEMEIYGRLDNDGSTKTTILRVNKWNRVFKRKESTLNSRFSSAFSLTQISKNDFIISGDGLSKSFWRYVCARYQLISSLDVK